MNWAWSSIKARSSSYVQTKLPGGLFSPASRVSVWPTSSRWRFWGHLWGMRPQSMHVCGNIELLELMGDRLNHLHSHDAITLLHHSFAIPKMLHVLHTSPCFSSPHLEDYDVLLHSILSNIINIRFEDNQSSWIYVTLPVSKGGLGIRSAVHFASSAFLARSL